VATQGNVSKTQECDHVNLPKQKKIRLALQDNLPEDPSFDGDQGSTGGTLDTLSVDSWDSGNYFDGVDCCNSDNNSSNDSSSDDDDNDGDNPAGSNDTSENCDEETPTHVPFSHPVCMVPQHTRFQLKLEKIRNSHRADQKLFNDVVDLVKEFSVGSQLSFSSRRLRGRRRFLASLEKQFNTTKLKPKNVPVTFSDGTVGTVSVFDIEEQMNALLTNPELMQEKNLARGLDVFTGVETELSDKFGEIHTGESWSRAVAHHIKDGSGDMPIGLVVFGDKSHFDTHGALATTPLSFTLSIFNQEARNSVKFWRPIAYIPNLDQNNVSDLDTDQETIPRNPSTAEDSLKDEQKCLGIALHSLKKVHRQGGFLTTVLGRPVHVRVWIHFLVGDTHGNNRWVAHYNSSGKLKRPYRDCKCSFADMANVDPDCVYIRPEEIAHCVSVSDAAKTKAGRENPMKAISKHNVKLAFHHKHVPLSDPIHGLYKMLPPEGLHTTAEGTSLRIFESLTGTIGKNADGLRAATCIERVFLKLHHSLSRNSERDLPRGATTSGLLKSTRIWAYQRQGNVFRLLCVLHTTKVRKVLGPILEKKGLSVSKMVKLLKLYLSMEAWFHATNSKKKVHAARPLIASIIQMLRDNFPRGGQGWHLPKTHGLTKMQTFMILFGSAINFYGGIGESNHKDYVKDTGTITQKRGKLFTSQCAHHCYETLVVGLVDTLITRNDSLMFTNPDKTVCRKRNNWQGEYRVAVTNIGIHQSVDCCWTASKKQKEKCFFDKLILQNISTHLIDLGWTDSYGLLGYTEMTLFLDGRYEQFRFCESYKGRIWYDSCLLEHWNEEKEATEIRAAQMHSLVKFDRNVMVMDISMYIVVSLSHDCISMHDLEQKFVGKYTMSNQMVIVPVSAITHPLARWENEGGGKDEYFCALPHRKWPGYFSARIKDTI
jgi:hypothetical protein